MGCARRWAVAAQSLKPPENGNVSVSGRHWIQAAVGGARPARQDIQSAELQGDNFFFFSSR